MPSGNVNLLNVELTRDEDMACMENNENNVMFMRNTARPKPIAMPINSVAGISPNSMMNPPFGCSESIIMSNGMHANIRKSFKNLRMLSLCYFIIFTFVLFLLIL